MANFRNFENQLRNFLINKITDNNEKARAMRKYGNIRFAMDHNKFERPHFIVRFGISEATFDIDTGMLLAGGLGNDANQIKAWVSKYLNKTEMKSIWQTEHKNYLIKKEIEQLALENQQNTK